MNCSRCGKPLIAGKSYFGHETAVWHEKCPVDPSTNELELRRQLALLKGKDGNYVLSSVFNFPALVNFISEYTDKTTREAILTRSDTELEKLRAEINFELDKRSQDYMKTN